METNDERKTIGDFLVADFRVISVLLMLEIDLVTSKNETISQVCQRKGIDPVEVSNRLTRKLSFQDGQQTDYSSWPLNLIADYINIHRQNIEEKLTVLLLGLNEPCSIYGRRMPQLFHMKNVVTQLLDRFSEGLRSERNLLFSFLKTFFLGERKQKITSRKTSVNIKNVVCLMVEENKVRLQLLNKVVLLRKECEFNLLTNETFVKLIDTMRQSEITVLKHISLENDLLFPGVLEIINIPDHGF